MQFIKNHYEKILLGAVLLGLVGVLVAMWVKVQADREKMDALKNTYFPKTPTPLPDLDLKAQDEVMNRVSTPLTLDWSTTNRLFNPVQWLVDKNGKLIKVENPNQIGPGAVVVTNIEPLYFIITLESATTNELGGRYIITEEDQSAPAAYQRRVRRHYASVGEVVSDDRVVPGKDEGFKLVAVKGPPENPDELDLKLSGTGETVVVKKNQPYRRVDGYTADLSYSPDKLSAQDLRVGSIVKFGGDSYEISRIDQNEVVLLAQSNQKRWTIHAKKMDASSAP